MQNFNEKLEGLDVWVIEHSKKWAFPLARFSIFLVYFWFGAIKVFTVDHGAAGPLVSALLEKTFLSGIQAETFLIVFGVLEMIIGLIFLMPKLERLGVFVLFLHLITTVMPLFLLPVYAWQGFMVPTIEGQYIIKNILIISAAITILSHLSAYKKLGIQDE